MYPDNDQLLEDKSLILNAIEFATGERAFAAEMLIRQPLDAYDERHLAYLAAQAYSHEVISTEDLVGWLAVLRDWEPGTVKKSLAFLLDRVDVSPKLEGELADEFETMSTADFRRLIHVPMESERLAAVGIPRELIDKTDIAIAAQLEGAKRVLSQRRQQERGVVVGYNKFKHVMAGIYRPVSKDVLIPARFSLQDDGVHMRTVTIEVSAANVVLMAGRAISTQAVLNAILGLIAWSRFGVPYSAQPWVLRAARSPIWVVGDDAVATTPPVLAPDSGTA